MDMRSTTGLAEMLDDEQTELIQALEKDHRRFRTLMQNTPLAIFVYEPDGSLVVNPAAEAMLGMKISPTAGNTQYRTRVLYPDGTPVPRDRLVSTRVLMHGETVMSEEYMFERPDGTRTPVLGTAAPIRDEDGRVIGGIGIAQDLTERHLAEKALLEAQRRLAESERLFRIVFELLPIGLWVADRNGRIVRANAAAERIWRGARYVSPEQFGEYRAWWIETGEPIAPENWALTRAIRHGETSRAELIRIKCFDGSFKTMINWAAPLRDEDGEISGAIALNEDVSQLHHTQEELRKAVADREQLLAIVSHDLRNPLAGAMMLAQTLEKQLASSPGSQPLAASAKSIFDVARRMSGLVDDLLAIAVAQSGKSLLSTAPVDARTILDTVAHSARLLLESEGLRLSVSVHDQLPPVRADVDRIVRVLTNLLDNAAKYTSSGGLVVVQAEPDSLGVRFSVANSGPSLTAHDMNAMLQPFWQGEDDNKRGVGLGLSICRSIVEAHGGSIWAEPAEGMRVRICFVLPLGNAG